MKRVLLVIVVVLVLAAVAYAQISPGVPVPRTAPRAPRPMRMAPLGPGPVMVAHNGFLFVLRGDQLLKVDTGDLQVKAQSTLPRPAPPEPPPGE